ncbi:RHS repeat protein, partial [Trinickia fusca]
MNAATGNLVLQGRDDYLASHGGPVGVLRTYNSQGQFADGGSDWIFGAAQCRLQVNGTIGATSSSITRTGPDGAQTTFTFDVASGTYVSSDGAGANDRIRYDKTTNGLILTNGTSNVSESYESGGLGRVLSTTDPAGNKVVYGYDSQNRLASIGDASGESIAFGYDGSGNVTSISTKLKDGTVVTGVNYAYDSQKRLTGASVTLNPVNGSGAAAHVYTTTYTYDGSSERIASVTQSDGTTQSLTYVQVGTDYRVASLTSGDGHVTRFDYDTVNRSTTVTDALGLKSTYSYDAQGRLTQLSSPAVAGVAQTTTFSYGTGGHVTQIVDASGHAVTMQYDGNGNQVMQQDASGNTITRTFSASNRLLTETVYLTPANGTTAPQQPLTTRNVYDDQGLLRFTISPEGRVSEYRYNGTGERTSIIQYGGSSAYSLAALSPTDAPTLAQMQSWQAKADMTQGSRVDMTYDLRGLLASQTTYASVDAQGNGIQDGKQAKTQYVHDQAGRLLTTIDAQGNTTQVLYDGLGRVLSTTDALRHTTLTQYDDAHNKTVVALANGLTTISAYDNDGLLISQVQTDAAAHVLGQTTYTYDADDRLRMTQDPTGGRHYLLYDDAGRKVADIDGTGALTETRYDQNNAVTETIAYDTSVSASNLASLLDANGNPANVTLASIRPASSPSDHVTRNIYDASGRLAITIGAAGGVTQTVYDGASRIVSVIRYATPVNLVSLGDNPTMAGATPTPSAQDRIARNFYDEDGLLRGTLDGEGYLVEYRYDASGRQVERIAYAHQTDASLRASANLAALMPSADAADIYSYTLYNSRGQVTGQIDGEGFLTESLYDSAGNLAQSIRYATAVTAQAGATVASLRPVSSAADQVVSYTYTALNQRATSVDAEGTTTAYSYDSIGNLISTNRAAGTADQRTLTNRYDLQGRLTGELSAQGAALLKDGLTADQINAIWTQYGTTYTYDAAGRRTGATDPNGNTTLFYYDQDGRLTQTVNALGEVQERQYDALGQLTGTVKYGTRIAITGLTGGLANGALINALDTIRNPVLDSHTSITYTATGLVATTTDALGNVNSNTYDAFGDVVSSHTAIDAAQALTQTFSYDRRGLQTGTVADPLGIAAAASTQYDAFGRAIRSVDANGNVRTQRYDRLGRVIQTVDPVNAQRSTTYDAFSRVLSTTDASGTTTYTYDTAGRSVTVTSPGGVSITTVHTRNGQTTSVKDGLGNVTSFAYDSNGNLIQTRTPLTQTASQYDAANRLIQTTDANGNTVIYSYDAANRLLQQRVDPNGLNLTTSYQYDAKGQRITTTDPNGTVTQIRYDAKGQQVSQTVDPGGLNLVTQYSYDSRGKTLTVTSPTGIVTQYVYDILGRRIEQHVDSSGLNLTTRTTYDKNGNAVSVTDPDGNTTRYVYDANDRQVFAIDPMGNVTQTVYDQAGHVAQTTAYATAVSLTGLSMTPAIGDVQALLVANPATDITQIRRYDADGRLAWTVDGTGGVVHYEYDANGNATKRTVYANRLNASDLAALQKSDSHPLPVADAAHDQIIRTAYDSLGRAVYAMDATGAVVEQHFDGNGNVLERISYAKAMAAEQFTTLQNIAACLQGVADAAHDGHVVNQYDAANRLQYTANAAGAVSQFVYDKDNNLTSRTDYATCLKGPLTAGSNLSSVVAGAADRTTRYAYDTANRRIATLDAAGALTAQIVDAAGNVAKLVQYRFVDATVKTAADAYARYIGSVNWDSTSGAAHCVTLNTYDAAGRLIQKTTRSGATASATVRYDYDAAGNLTKTTDPLGGTTTQKFDACGRKTSTSVLLSAATATTPAQYAVTTTQYDAFGNAVAVTDPLGHTGYFYFDHNNRVVLQVDPLGYATQTTYAPSGKPGLVTRYATAVAGKLSISAPPTLTVSTSDATTTFEYDQDARLIKSTDAQGNAESFAYDGVGNRVSHTGKTGGVTVSTYDNRGLLLSETLPVTSSDSTGAQKSVVNAYRYDAFGNRTQMIEAAGLPEQRTTTYAYDPDNRLITQTGDAIAIQDAQGSRTVSPTQHWTYDAAGNKTSWTDANGNVSRWAYDAANRKIAELSAVGTLSTWNYDAASNVVSAQVYDDAVAPNTDGTIPNPAAGAACRQTTYTYDAGNRQIGTQVTGVAYGERPPGGTNYDYFVAATITTSRQYDALGNVVAQTDGRGNTTRSYYNALGQKIAQVDANNDLTVWTLDQNGNTTEERDYANRLSLVVDATTAVSQLIANVGSSTSDRITDSTYDHLGRLLTQSRLAVQSATIDGNGGLTQTTGAATTRYVYDGLGNVIEKTEANGDVTDWTFDAMGRQIEKKGAAFTDFEGALVRPTTDTVYDGLGNVTESIARGKVSTGDRVTQFTHNAAGYRTGQFTQGVAGSYQYKTDAVGNTTEVDVYGLDANGNATLDSTVIGYDAANREISRQARSAKNGDPAQGWINSVTHNIRYNAHGEITGKGLNGSYTEFDQYDSLGRLWKTNSGNGATKVYLYDKNGNATMLIESAGADLSGMTLDQIMQTSLTQGASSDPVVAAAIAAGGVHMTASVYDANNRLTDTYQPTMQSAQSMGVVQRFLTQQAGTNYTVGQVLVGPTAADAAQSSALPDPSVRGGVAISGTGLGISATFSYTYTFWPAGRNENFRVPLVTAETYNVSVPAGLRYGTGNLHFAVGGRDVLGPCHWNQTAFTWSYPDPMSGPYSGPFDPFDPDGQPFPLQVFQDVPGGGRRLIAVTQGITHPSPPRAGNGQHGSMSGSGGMPSLLQIQGQSPSTARILAMRRPAGSNGAWTPFYLSPMMTAAGAVISGWYVTDWSGWGAGRWDYQYFAHDGNGTVLNAETGTIDTTNPSWPGISQNALPIGGVGQSYMTSDGNLVFLGQPPSAQSLTVSYRKMPSGAWATRVLGAYPTGCFQFSLAGLSGDYEYRIASYTGWNAGSLLSEARGTFNPAGSASALTSLTNIPENVTFNNQPASSATMDLTYSVNGGPGTTVTLGWDATRQQFNWDASAVAPDPMKSYLVTYSFKVKDKNGAIVNAGSNGQLRLGFNAGEAAAYTPDQRPPTVTFSPPNVPNATQMALQYRTAGSTGPYTPVALVKDGNGNFVWDVTGLRPATGALNLEYAYTLLDANGNKVAGSNGFSIDEGTLTINADGSSNTWRLAWTVTGLNNKSTDNAQDAIHRSQAYDAFGDIVSETDGRGNTTTLAYDTNGHLIRKTAPQTHATQEDGTVVSVTPTTNYYYGASGLLAGVQDANGNLNTQTRLAGFGTAGNSSDSRYATTQFEAGGVKKTFGYDIFGEVITQTDELGRVTTNTYDTAGRLIKVSRPGGDTDSYTYDTQGERISHTNALNRRETTD